jgi:hypothetical protein
MNFEIQLKKSVFPKLMVFLLMGQLTVGIVLGQSNHFPATGNVGLGLTNPSAQLHMLRGATTPTYPSGNSRGDIHQLFTAGNNAIEIGNARGTNNRRAWILA